MCIYVCVCVCVYIYVCVCVCVCVYVTSFFIHLSVDGHLCCFHVLTIVNGAAVNIGVHVSFHIVVVSGFMGMEFLLKTALSGQAAEFFVFTDR